MKLGLSHTVLDKDSDGPRWPKKGHSSLPNFRPMSNSWIDQHDTWYGSRPQPHCVRWGPSWPTKGHSSPPPTFRPMSVVATRLDGSRCHLVRRRTRPRRHCVRRTPPRKAHRTPLFGPCLSEAMTGHSTSVLVPCSSFGFRPDLLSPQKKAQQPLLFGPCLLWLTVASLSHCWALVKVVSPVDSAVNL